MISDYSKTMELVDAAYNSAGSGQRQFEKTLDSLQSKLMKLKNAWDEFTMGLANNQIIGFAVEQLTNLLTVVNNIINGISGDNGLIKSVLSLGAVIGGLKLGGVLFDKALQSQSVQKVFKTLTGQTKKEKTIEKAFEEKGQSSFESFLEGFSKIKNKDTRKDTLMKSLFGISPDFVKDFKEQYFDKIEKVGAGKGKEFEVLTDSFVNGSIGVKEYATELNVLINNEESAIEIAQRLEQQMDRQKVMFNQTGKTISAMGGSLMVLGGIISSISPETEKLGQVVQNLGIAFAGIGQVVRVFPEIKKGFTKISGLLNLAPGKLGIILVMISVISATVVGLIRYLKTQTPEAKLEKISQTTQKAKETASEASQAYDELAEKQNSLGEMVNKLENLTQGSLEWKKALVELNNEILALKANFPELELSIDEATGRLSVDNYDAILKRQLAQAENANRQLTFDTIQQTKAQLEADIEKVNKNSDLSDVEKQSQIQSLRTSAMVSNLASLQSMGDSLPDFANSLAQAFLKEEEIWKKVDTDQGQGAAQYKNVRETVGSLLTVLEKEARTNVGYMSNSTRKKRYEEIYGKDSAKDMSNDEIRNALISTETGNLYNQVIESISKLDSDSQELIYALSGSLSTDAKSVFGGTVDLQNLLNGADADQVASILGITREELEGRLQEGIDLINGEKEKIQESFGDINPALYENYSYALVKNLSSQISVLTKESAERYLTDFGELLENSNLDSAQKTQLENYLSSIDLTNMADIINAQDFMSSLGFNQREIENFWGAINKSCQPYITSLEQVSSLNDKISSLGSVRDLASEGKTTFTGDEKESLIGAGFQTADFLQTGFDEWTYIGDTTNSLLEQIDEKVGIISGQTIDALNKSITMGEQYSSALENNPELKSNLALLAENGLSGTSFTEAQLRAWAMSLGVDTTGLSAEGIAKILGDIYTVVENLDANRASVEQQRLNMASLQYETSGNFGTFTGNLSQEDQEKILQAQLAKYSGAQEYYLKLMNEAGKDIKDFNIALADEAIQLVKASKQYVKTAESVETYRDALVQGESAGMDFFSALNTAKQDLSTLFNVEPSLISDDFIRQNAQDIYNLAEGGELGTQAFRNLYVQLSEIKKQDTFEQLRKGLEGVVDDVDEVAKWISELNPSLEVQFLAEGTVLYNALNQIIKESKKTGQAAIEALSPVLSMIETITGIKIQANYSTQTKTARNDAEAATLTEQGWKRIGNSRKFIRTNQLSFSYSSNSNGSMLDKFVAPDLSSGGSSSGSGSSSKKDSTWENPYDKLYNLTEQINEALRQREKLEREYDRILERRGSTFGELRKNYNSQINSLKEEVKLQERLRTGRLDELNKLASETYKGQDVDGNELIKSFASWGATKYANYNPNTGVITIDWNAIDKVKDENQGGAIEAYISRLEELQSQIEDVDSQIEDFQDRIIELQKEGMSDYLDFEQKVYDAIVNQQQEIIDNYQDLTDKISNSNKDILDSIQQSIDLQRQIRDNTKTEQDINEKEARLAYLRRDTSNGNLLEIKQLEEELADSRQDYEDSLIDQQLERLTKQNDDAQTAREKQIELMQAQLDYASQNGEFWSRAYELITSGFSADGNLNQASQLWNLLKDDEGWQGMSKFGQLNWQEEISKAILAASQGYANWNMYKAEKVDKSLTLGNGTQLTFDGKNWKDKNGNVYNGVDYDSKSGQFIYSGMTPSKPSSGSGSGGAGSSKGSGSSGKVGIGSRVKVDPNAMIYATSFGEGGGRQYYANDPIYNVIDENNGYYLTRYHKLGAGWTGWFRKQDVKAYKKGGLADFTGPAWLDGTTSNPELILNAKDTENFIALKNILGDFMAQRGNSGTTPNGDMYFDIDIHVDELADDYDVDALTKKIKQDLTNSATYRNVNLINFIR